MRAEMSWLVEGYDLGDIWCLAFVKDIDPVAALQRIGADRDTFRALTLQQVMDDGLFPDTVVAGRFCDWTVIFEVNGWTADSAAVLARLAYRTTAVVVLNHPYASSRFVYAVDGEIITNFDPISANKRYGSDPDRLLADLRDSGIDPGRRPGDPGKRAGVAELLVLANRLTGVTLTPDVMSAVLQGATFNRVNLLPSAPESPVTDLFRQVRELKGNTQPDGGGTPGT